MKRLLTLAVMFLCCIANSFAQFSGSGSGTENDPYLILNPIQLNQMRNFLNKSDVYFKLMADIDLADFIEDEYGENGWLPIGDSSSKFCGMLDGNGKTIFGLRINRSGSDKVGLFGCTKNAVVKKLTLYVDIKGNNYVGGICGSESIEISECTLYGTVSGASYVGGFCGEGGVLSSNISYLKVQGSGDCIGGFVGANSVSIQNCSAINSLTSGNNKVGGIVGTLQYWTGHTDSKDIFNCSFTGSVSGATNVGGIVGEADRANISNSYVIGNISGANYSGGIAGAMRDTYDDGYRRASNAVCSNCYFCGIVNGGINVGGITGYLHRMRMVSCFSYGTISGKENIGGLCGFLEGRVWNDVSSIRNCIAINGRVSSIDGKCGRIFGKANNWRVDGNKAWNKTIIIEFGIAKDIEENDQNGIGVSATTLKLKATYVAMSWDFNDTWDIQETECYPYMKSQTAPPVIQSQVVSGATTVSGKCVDGGTITLEIDGVKQQMVSTGQEFSFTVSPLQAGHEVRVSAKTDGKEQSYYATEVVSFLGKGTETDPYQISTAADLTQVYRKGYYKLMNDIDLTDYINQFSPTEGWLSIGRDGSETIHFDGDGHKVTGLWCNSTRDNTGLFSCFANGTIKNLTVKTVPNKQVKGGANTGIIIGKMINGTIENCSVEGSVADGTPVGGLVGLFDGGSISKCKANVTINTTLEASYVGGLVGEITGGTIDQCFTKGSLTGAGNESYVGGLIGKNQGTLTNSYSTAVINSSYNAAGVVAYNYGLVDKCYATGNLHSNNYAAGVIGYNDGANAVVSNCAAMNNILDVVYESQQQQQGGGYGQRIIGGIKNGAPAPEMNNYALKTMQVSLNDVPQKVYDDIMNGTAKTNEELQQEATYQTIGWDFDNVWKIDEGTTYPYQTIKINGGSAPSDSDEPENPDPTEPQEADTDYSTMDNVIYLQRVEAAVGSQVQLSVKMKNTVSVQGYQFDLYLPDGVSVAKDGDGFAMAELSTARTTEKKTDYFNTSTLGDGAFRVLCGSSGGYTFSGEDGEVAVITLDIADGMQEGEYPVILREVKLSDKNSQAYVTDYMKSTLAVSSYTIGDANNDGGIDVADFIAVANCILGNAPAGFVEKAADVNEDGSIDVADFIAVANMILNGTSASPQSLSLAFGTEEQEVSEVTEAANSIYIEPLTAAPGSQQVLSVRMRNAGDVAGYQFTLQLPDGITVAKDGDEMLMAELSTARTTKKKTDYFNSVIQSDGTLKVLCGTSTENPSTGKLYTFEGNDGEVARITIDIPSGYTFGDYDILIKEAKISDPEAVKTELDDTQAVLSVADVKNWVVLDENSTTAPDEAAGVDVKVKRTINAGEWSTICLPFAMSEEQVTAAFGEGVQLADFTSWSSEEDNDGNIVGIKIGFTDVTSIEANHPYIIKVGESISEFTAEGVDVEPEDEPYVQVGVKKAERGYFIGTYVAGTDVPEDNLFLSSNKFWYSAGITQTKAFRGFFELADVLTDMENSGNSIEITFDGNATGISTVKGKRAIDGSIYNLQGQRMMKPVKGVNIVEGRKIVIE